VVDVAGQRPGGIVLVAHGGMVKSEAPVTSSQLAVLRMIPLARAIRQAVGDGIEVRRPLFRVRGWNGALASPVADLTGLLDEIHAQFSEVPVVLVGHSMGARAALRVAGHPAVVAVAGLAPWLPSGEPVDQLAGRRVLLAHGSADMTTSPVETWAYGERARALCDLTTIEIRHGDHPMLRRAALWHAIAAEFTRVSLGLPGSAGEAAVAIAAGAGGARLITIS
jgi:pimeloyl-ACP methyl ester carboxylesterase